MTVKTLLSNLILMRESLERIREAQGGQAFIYAQQLVNALLRQKGNNGGFEKRFSHMFADQDLLMATALHPNYGMSSFDFMAPHMNEEILERLVQEIRCSSGQRGGGNSQGIMEEQDDDRMDAFAKL